VNLIETLEIIAADRLRIDSAGAWADSQHTWKDRKLGTFYDSTAGAIRAILLIGRELSYRKPDVPELNATQAGGLADLDQPVWVILEGIAELIEMERQLERGSPIRRGRNRFVLDAAEGQYTPVRIFYGTDRWEEAGGRTGISYSHERSAGGELHFGQCLVTVPRRHKLGVVESPSILRLEFTADPCKHIVLHSIVKREEADFLKRVARAVAQSADLEAFIFVHGYNVSFETAARRTAQIAFDLKFTGAPILYSWPSNGRIGAYMFDEANAIWTVPHFDRFLTLIAQHSGAARLHVIAHSMGNRAVCDALKVIAGRAHEEGRPKLQELILAAPDIDADTFRQMADAVRSRTERVTLYASSKDKAMELSRKIHGHSRAGIPMLILPGVDSVDASAVNTDFLAHSYFCEDRSVLSDIYNVIRTNSPPEKRFDLTQVPGPAGKYYVFRN
jgi:esterase/lipase superfamily enzyme